ncbi:MAG: hypothetical protein ACLFTK_15495 [Anaerolineales bacterium]
MHRKIVVCLLVVTLIGSVWGMSMLGAQDVPEIQVQITTNQIVYSGPSENSIYYEYVANGRIVPAVGRTTDSEWVMISLNRQVQGWVPAASVSVQAGSLGDLIVRMGKLPSAADAPYSVDNPQIRTAQIEMIRVNRPLRLIVARYNRLQGFSGASCQDIPTAPAFPSFSARQIAAVPELERIERELSFVAQHTTDAIAVYQVLCGEGGEVTEETYLRGIGHINEAQSAYNVLQRYIEELTGVPFHP